MNCPAEWGMFANQADPVVVCRMFTRGAKASWRKSTCHKRKI